MSEEFSDTDEFDIQFFQSNPSIIKTRKFI
jgi:hypothetical protein